MAFAIETNENVDHKPWRAIFLIIGADGVIYVYMLIMFSYVLCIVSTQNIKSHRLQYF